MGLRVLPYAESLIPRVPGQDFYPKCVPVHSAINENLSYTEKPTNIMYTDHPRCLVARIRVLCSVAELRFCCLRVCQGTV